MTPRTRRAALRPLAPVTALLLAIVALAVPTGAAQADTLPAVTNAFGPTIAGTANSGAPLTAHPGVWDPADGTEFTYQWLRNGVDVADATGSTFTPVLTGLDGVLGAWPKYSVRVTATHDGFTTASATSSAVTVVRTGGATSPENTAAPSVTNTAGDGAPIVGTAVTADRGDWSQDGTFTLQWLADGTPVPGATGSSYTPRSADVGKQLSVRVYNTVGDLTGLATSSATAATIGAPAQVAEPTAVPGDREATVSWDQPADNGSAIDSYVVLSNPGAGTCSTTGELSCTITGLANGTAYTFTVTAANAVGSSPRSEQSEPVTPAAVPARVAKPTATPGLEAAIVSWTAPATNGSALTGYTVTASPGGATVTVGADETTATVEGLDNGTTYTFTVTATNAVGDSPASEPSDAVTPTTAPEQVAKPIATRGDRSAVVEWTAPEDNGSPLTRYVVIATPGDKSVTVEGDETSATFTGLTNGTAYTFTVTAENVIGQAPVSEPSDAVTPAAVPGRVGKPTATRGNGAATVTWTAVTGNGSPVTGYTITTAPGGKTVTVTGDAETATVDGLDNGTAYSFTVTATNAIGDSPASAASDAVTPATVPGAVGKPVATRGDRSATVSWDAPDDNGSPLTRYTVIASPGGRTVTIEGDTTVAVVTGLDNGTAYTFTVVARNALGDGSTSVASDAVTPATLPDRVAKPTATAGAQTATVTWAAVTGNGSPVTGYTVTAAPGGKTATVDGDTLTATVEDLDYGTAYTFTVTATNAVGTSPASVASDAVTPVGVPAAPSDVTATRGDRSATVSWTAPDDNGSAIVGHVVRANPGGKFKIVWSPATTTTLDGLENGTAYTFTVTATNAVGNSPTSEASNEVTPAAVPDQVAKPTAVRGDKSATVTWAKPSGNGTPITGYTVTAAPGGESVTVDGDTTTATVTGLANGTAYSFTVVATNAVGNSPASDPSNEVTPAAVPDRVAKPTAVRGDKSATVTWTEPSGNGTPLTGYTVTAAPGGKTATVDGDTTTATIDGLDNGTAYTFTVVATNAVGNSPASETSNEVTPVGSARGPMTVTAQRGNKAATVSWTDGDGNGAPITGYVITTSPGGQQVTVSPDVRRTVIRGLQNGRAYTFTVAATTAVGASPDSAASNPVVPARRPGKVSKPKLTLKGKRLVVSWHRPESHGSPVTRYVVRVAGKLKTVRSTAGRRIVLRGVLPGTYRVKVFAYNDLGRSGPSRIAKVRVRR